MMRGTSAFGMKSSEILSEPVASRSFTSSTDRLPTNLLAVVPPATARVDWSTTGPTMP
jgi:hypothetical protein